MGRIAYGMPYSHHSACIPLIGYDYGMGAMAGRGRPRKYREGESPTPSIRARLRYEKYKSEGKCVRCGKADAEEGLVSCRNCMDREKAARQMRFIPHPKILKDPQLIKETERSWQRQAYQKRKSAGLCVRCRKSNETEKAYCPDCLIVMAVRSKKSTDKVRSRGICIKCRKNQAGDGFAWCESCRMERKERMGAK